MIIKSRQATITVKWMIADAQLRKTDMEGF